MKDIIITTKREDKFFEFLAQHEFTVEELGNEVFKVTRHDELPVFLYISDESLYFEVDMGNVSQLASQEFYFNLLNLNTEILPVSFGINNSNPEDPRLVLVESRETGDLSDMELLSVFDALEIASEKAESFLSEAMKG